MEEKETVRVKVMLALIGRRGEKIAESVLENMPATTLDSSWSVLADGHAKKGVVPYKTRKNNFTHATYTYTHTLMYACLFYVAHP